MRPSRNVVTLVLLVFGAPALLGAIELQPETLRSWDDYIRVAESRLQGRLDGSKHFLWVDEAPDRVARLRRGEVLVAPVAPAGQVAVPGGLIHDWIGAVFIPGASLSDLFSVVHDYDHYKQFYKPVVADSRTLACAASDQKFSMVWQNRILFVNAAVQGEYEAHDTLLDGARGYNIARTVSMQEIEGYRRRGELLLPPGQGNGFIWRIHSIARYEQRDGGVYLELEAIALTRAIPPSLAWLVTPVVSRLSSGSLTTTLRQTRAATIAVAGGTTRLASCSGLRDSAVTASIRRAP
jgi:hypothetical protein